MYYTTSDLEQKFDHVTSTDRDYHENIAGDFWVHPRVGDAHAVAVKGVQTRCPGVDGGCYESWTIKPLGGRIPETNSRTLDDDIEQMPGPDGAFVCPSCDTVVLGLLDCKRVRDAAAKWGDAE